MSQDIYFKLVRPDLTSFYDEKFKWPEKGIVEIPNASPNGPCGVGAHLAKSVKDGLQYAKFPFRILKVRPLSPILGEDDTKIRVAKAESLGQIKIPAWALKLEKRIENLPAEMRVIPWFTGRDGEKVKRLLSSHFKLLVPFGFKLDFEIEILTEKVEASKAFGAAWDAAGDAAWGAAWGAAGDAARDAAGAAARDAAWDAARDAAWDAARDALKPTTEWLQASALNLVREMIDVKAEA